MVGNGSLGDRLKKFDAHSSVSGEFRVHTGTGAILSVVTVLIILYLLITEYSYNFAMVQRERVFVNATNNRGLELEFDVSVHHVPCSKLQIDANDPQGQTQSLHLDAKHHIWKHRIKYDPETGHRQLIGSRSRLEQGSVLLTEEDLTMGVEDNGMLDDVPSDVEDGCGSCFGAGEEGECCNTCDDVKRAYTQKGWMMDADTLAKIVLCKHTQTQEDEGEGCNVHGTVALDTGGGNLHIAPGLGAAEGAFSILDMLMQTFQQWNVSHTIHKVRFGPEHPSAIYQLDDQSRTVEDTTGMYQYYFKIVPTVFQYQNGTSVHTNQYSVMEHLRHVNPGSNRGLPGVFFFYEVSPLHVEVSEGYQRGYTEFFTSVCAVIGGVVTVMGLLDQFIFSRGRRGQDELMR